MKYFLVIASSIFILFGFFTPSSAFARSLSFGLSGPDVVALQNTLISKGVLAAGRNTGYFGARTEEAVKKFQCAQSIICSGTRANGYGIAGPRTQAALGLSSGGGGTQAPLEFSGWIPYWRTASGTADVFPHLSQLKSIMPFGYTMHEDGTLADTAKITQEPWTSLIAEAKRQGVRVIPTVMWGDGDSIHKILSNTKTRIALEDEIANTVKQNGFDGIDIDFEAKKHETIGYFSTFLKGLYQRMGNKWVYCTVEARMPLDHRYLPGTPIPPDAMDYSNDYIEMNKYCDRIEIMAYDQGIVDKKLNSIRQHPYAPVADPLWVEALVNLASQTISKNKIIIGVPTYGYEYSVTPNGSGGFQYDRLWAFNPKYALETGAKLGTTPARNSAGEMGLSYDPILLSAIERNATTTTATPVAVDMTQPFRYLSWSDSLAVATRVAQARALGVRGIALFKFDGGQDPGIWDVLK